MDATCSPHTPAGQGNSTFNLLNLPPELIQKVIDHAVFDEAGIMNFALTSTRFFYIIQERVMKTRYPDPPRRPSFNSQDLEAIQKTVDSSVSPLNTAWKMDRTYDDPCLKNLRYSRRQTPLVRLIEHYLPVNLGGHYVDGISMEATYHTIEWMLDKGADVNMDSHPRWYQGPFVSANAIPGPHHPPSKPPLHHLLSQLLIKGIDHNRINAVVKLVSFLCNRGAVIPADLHRYTQTLWRESLPGLIDAPPGMFSMAFLARFPPSILESFLTQFSRRNFNWTSRSHQRPKQLDGWWDDGKLSYLGHHWRFETSPVSIVEVTFNNFFHPDLYYQDVETLDEKVKLLIKFKAIDEMEQKAFRQLVGAAREIDVLRKQAGGLTFEQHGMVCWYKLSRFITTLAEQISKQEKRDKEYAEGYRFHAFTPQVRDSDIVFHWISQTYHEIFRKVFSQHELTYYADDAIQSTIFANDPTKLQLVRDSETLRQALRDDEKIARDQVLLGFRGISQNCDAEFWTESTRNLTAWYKSYCQNNEI
ncbi:hypothetical protein BGZ61DRAFT_480853 [Ilyonectria robusta]|uniref:uncharacterized protein n=1 Tax=Ilyonectria robusta TaxID=1079257 RepID=UPI001E8EB580|nr:uncharacterized protein BGZ61DRAFT_480853 [Ilyonectria robusta]KAH8680151.1 hypothetical protein BGZ61DRAFT_480853 [Ilyonectria robusta]